MKSKLTALCLCAAMVLGSLLVAAPARAGDTSNTLVVDIRGAVNPPATVTFYDVAWTANGRFALYVGTEPAGPYGVAWWYDPTKVGDAAWTPAVLSIGTPIATQFKCVLWNPDNNMFVITGDATSGRWYHVDFPGQFLVESAPDADLASASPYIEDLAYMGSFMYGVGRMGTQSYVFQYNCLSWDWVLLAGSTVSNVNWYACEMYNGDVYCCGSNAGSDGVYAYFDVPSGPYNYLASPTGMIFTDMALDTFDYDRMILTVRSRASSTMGLIEASGSALEVLDGLAELPTVYDLNAIDIQADGFAVAVGRDISTGNGLVYDIWWTGATTTVMKRSQAAPPYSGQNFQAVAIRPTGVQMALIAGSSFKYSYTSVVAPIQVDTGVPHFNYIDIYPLGGTLSNSFINGQCDVDIGDSMTQYVLEAEIYDPLGWARMTTIEAWLWYDNMGIAMDVPTSMGAAFDAAGGENLRMHFTIDDTSAAAQIYPPAAPGTDETTLNLGLCTWNQINVTSGTVRFVFSPHQQVRYAPGGFTQAVGMRYGGGVAEGQSVLAALDSANTWDIKMTVTDDAPTPNEDSAFDEFGFYKYTYLGAAGIPNGGAVYGSGAPGTNNVVMAQSNADVEFCANCPYTLSVTLASALIGVAVPANTIPGTAVSIRGGQIGAENFFGAAGSTITLIGGPQISRVAERTTTTSSWDNDPGTNELVVWEVNIPGVPEDSYVSTITWALTN